MSAEQTRERIIEAAGRLFAAQGFNGTSTRQVGSEAGANIATIAYHFGGKEGLYLATLERKYEEILEVPLPEQLDGSPEERVRALVDAIWRFCRQRPDAVRLLLRHVVDHGSLPDAVNESQSRRAMQRALDLQQALALPSLMERPMALLSLNHLLARYAISPDGALAPFVGEEDPAEAVSRHLGDVAVLLLLDSPPG